MLWKKSTLPPWVGPKNVIFDGKVVFHKKKLLLKNSLEESKSF